VADFNGDGKPDYLLHNSSTRQTGYGILTTMFALVALTAPRCYPAGRGRAVATSLTTDLGGMSLEFSPGDMR
jgi:hypothetical protein